MKRFWLVEFDTVCQSQCTWGIDNFKLGTLQSTLGSPALFLRLIWASASVYDRSESVVLFWHSFVSLTRSIRFTDAQLSLLLSSLATWICNLLFRALQSSTNFKLFTTQAFSIRFPRLKTIGHRYVCTWVLYWFCPCDCSLSSITCGLNDSFGLAAFYVRWTRSRSCVVKQPCLLHFVFLVYFIFALVSCTAYYSVFYFLFTDKTGNGSLSLSRALFFGEQRLKLRKSSSLERIFTSTIWRVKFSIWRRLGYQADRFQYNSYISFSAYGPSRYSNGNKTFYGAPCKTSKDQITDPVGLRGD